ncbi:MAG: HlyD family efflux transporter periplasmic adaptor subunit [Caldimicrobium sp.]|nr:HlyD family efflux transporter periplasmic adaptor subunit [Caldimicrobium sp.]MCX7873935.1 HlyD family efflux transporter periplasmic adaptor subunit [Caldimicrobium sp.]
MSPYGFINTIASLNFKRKVFLSLIIFLTLVFTLVFLVLKGVTVKDDKEYVEVKKKVFTKSIYAMGYVKPKNYVILRAEVSGVVNRIYVKEGDFVRAGEVLLSLDPGAKTHEIREIETKLSLIEIKLSENSDFLESLKKELEVAQINMKTEEEKLKRREKLYEEGLISKEDLEETKRRWAIYRHTYEKIKKQIYDAKVTLEKEKEMLKERRAFLLAELKRYQVRAPFSGVIYGIYVENGDYVNPLSGENKLLSIGTKEKEILLEVDEEHLSQIKEGQRVYLKFESYPEKMSTGKIKEIKKEVERGKRLIVVKVLPLEPLEVPVESTVEGYIVVGEREVLAIPEHALKGENLVEVKGRGVVKVSLGERKSGWIEVKEGLREGEKIALKGKIKNKN